MAFSRGRGSSRGTRGSRRGGKGFRGRGNKKSTYHSARLEQPLERDSDESSPSSEGSVPASEQFAEEDVSEDEETPTNALPPYSTLLQSLAANTRNDTPRFKRRKIEHEGRATNDSPSSPEYQRNNGLENGGGDPDQVEVIEETGLEAETVLDDPDEEDCSQDSQLSVMTMKLMDTVSDPFQSHIAEPNEDALAKELHAVVRNNFDVTKSEHDKLWKVTIYVPAQGSRNQHSGGRIRGPDNLMLKSKLKDAVKSFKPNFNSLESNIATYVFGYQDLLQCTRTVGNAPGLREISCLHAVNHVFKTRDKVIKNNAKLAKDGSNDEELRDQGFTRPKVLILLPTRDACLKIVETITSICQPEQQENKKRFLDGYSETEEKFSTEKPEDFRDLFGGNDDDMFRIGLKFTRKTLKFFAQFYNSDIILASPLGLRMAIGMEKNQKQDHDFLSSIEILIVDHADALLMQNWEHVDYILQHLNLQPKEAHGCDFSRVRTWYLDGHARHLRQTIVFSSFNTPELNQVFSKHMLNVAGRVKMTPIMYEGEIHELHLPIRTKQTFSRFDAPSPTVDPDARFEYFATAIAPSLAKKPQKAPRPDLAGGGNGGGTLVFVPSYLDFVRLRNHFTTSSSLSSLSFGCISEYTSVRDVARARSHFLSGRHAVLLYTERAHHFRRYRIRGVGKVVFYGLPENPMFYREVVGGFLQMGGAGLEKSTLGGPGATSGGVRCLFSKWDVLKLERVLEDANIDPAVAALDNPDGAGETTMTVSGAEEILHDAHLGDSISINGTCLTITSFTSTSFTVGISPETLRRTNLGRLTAPTSRVNLERAVSGSTRMGGHFMQGHVDTVATILSVVPDGESALTFRMQPQDRRCLRYVVEKGYVALDGVSLTVTDVDDAAGWWEVMLITYTQEKVVIAGKRAGEEVNVEVDMVGKYVEKSVRGMLEGDEIGGGVLERVIGRIVDERLRKAGVGKE
ncbi:MAG: rRNA-binding ribosome biosynthesis protein utp25 [Sclerophora amabilis]|nr:MAG: rRNA-binding ribosome biosynthesis protein utp25 [Sclerophora amabilis]